MRLNDSRLVTAFFTFLKAALRLGDDAHAADGQPLVEQGRAHHAGQAGRRPPAHPRPLDGVRPQRHDHQQQGEADELGQQVDHEDVRRRVRTPPAKSDIP
jgi:hypothetical protein